MIYNNKTAFAEAGFDRNFKSNYEVWGSKGTIKLERAYAVPQDFETEIQITKGDDKELIKIKAVDQTELMLKSFVEEISNIKKADFNFENDLLKQSKVLEAIRLSNKNKKFIYLEDIK